MTCRHTLNCLHEPFGDAYYYGPERLEARFDGDDEKETREKSGFSTVTYADVVDQIDRLAKEVRSSSQWLWPAFHPGEMLTLSVLTTV